MTEEEKNAIEYLKTRLYGNEGCRFIDVAQGDLRIFLDLVEKQDTEINKLNKEKEYYKKLYNESYNFLDPKFTGDHIPRID